MRLSNVLRESNKPSEVYREREVHRIQCSFAWQFCMAVLQYIVDHAISLKTSEVWWEDLFPHSHVLPLAKNR